MFYNIKRFTILDINDNGINNKKFNLINILIQQYVPKYTEPDWIARMPVK